MGIPSGLDSREPPGESGGGEPPTQALAQGALGDDPRAFAALYQRLAPALYAWACLRLRPSLRHVVDPEDVMQEVWCRALKRLHAYDPKKVSFRGWLFRIAELVMMEAFRGLRGRPLPGPGAALPSPPLEALAAELTTISRRVASRESLRRAVRELTTLPPEDQRLLLYRGLEGLPHQEVAARLELRPEAARKKWERLRRRLLTLRIPESLGVDLEA